MASLCSDNRSPGDLKPNFRDFQREEDDRSKAASKLTPVKTISLESGQTVFSATFGNGVGNFMFSFLSFARGQPLHLFGKSTSNSSKSGTN